MSTGASDPTLFDEDTDPRIELFDDLTASFERAERNRIRESPSYNAIAKILQAFSAASKSLDRNMTMATDVQPSLKGPDDAECSPDFAVVLIPRRASRRLPTQGHCDPTLKDSLVWIWEVKAFNVSTWFNNDMDKIDVASARAQKALKKHLRQLSGQALFAFYQYEGDTLPVFLSQGNCFTLLVYDRPTNWATFEVKYADKLKMGPRPSTGKEPPESGTSSAITQQEQGTSSQEQEAPARMSGDDNSPDISGQGSTNLPDKGIAENAKNTSTTASTASTASTEPLFEEGDYPIPRLFSSCEYILRPDGSGFTPQFIQAVHVSMALRNVTLKLSDRIFRLPDGQTLDSIHPTQTLTVAQEAIDAFKAERDARKLPEQSMSTESSASVHSEFKARRTAIVRPADGKLWRLRSYQVLYTSPKPLRKVANRNILRHLVAETSGPKRAQSSKKKTRGDQSQGAPTARVQVNAVAGPSNARVSRLHSEASSEAQGLDSSKKRVFDQVQDETTAPDEASGRSKEEDAGPTQSAVQDASSSKKRKLDLSGDSLEDGAHDEANADTSNEQIAGHSAEASTSTGNAKEPGQASRKGKEHAL